MLHQGISVVAASGHVPDAIKRQLKLCQKEQVTGQDLFGTFAKYKLEYKGLGLEDHCFALFRIAVAATPASQLPSQPHWCLSVGTVPAVAEP